VTDRRLRVIQRGEASSGDQIVALLDRTIRIVLPAGVPPWRHQLLSIALVDLLGRSFPRIEVIVDADAPSDPRLPPGPKRLAERLEMARGRGYKPQQPEADPVLTVQIGAGSDADVHADGAGWQSYVGSLPSRLRDDDGDVPVGPLVAAARAANQVFQLMLADQLAHSVFRVESAYASALTFEAATDPLDEPQLPPPAELNGVLVGAGSIGGAATYLFASVPRLEGRLDIVDDDTLKEHNPDRAILATEELCAAGAVKVDVAVAALAHHEGLDAHPHEKRFEAFVAERPRELALPLILSAVDSTGSRREIQDAVPLEVLDAACGVDQISCSGHRTDDGPCIYCLHVGAVLDSTRIKYRLISQATGIPEAAVAPLHVAQVPLTHQHVRAIEAHRREHGEAVPVGAFDDYIGKPLETLYREKFLYGEALIATEGGGQVAVAAPFVTALAGFMLASEALKASTSDAAYTPYRLGPAGQAGAMYREDPWRTPVTAVISNPPRWQTHECLCQSPLRLRLLRDRYAL
jgi:hypothetical protein